MYKIQLFLKWKQLDQLSKKNQMTALVTTLLSVKR